MGSRLSGALALVMLLAVALLLSHTPGPVSTAVQCIAGNCACNQPTTLATATNPGSSAGRPDGALPTFPEQR